LGLYVLKGCTRSKRDFGEKSVRQPSQPYYGTTKNPSVPTHLMVPQGDEKGVSTLTLHVLVQTPTNHNAKVQPTKTNKPSLQKFP
jgi:hypothetical protein